MSSKNDVIPGYAPPHSIEEPLKVRSVRRCGAIRAILIGARIAGAPAAVRQYMKWCLLSQAGECGLDITEDDLLGQSAVSDVLNEAPLLGEISEGLLACDGDASLLEVKDLFHDREPDIIPVLAKDGTVFGLLNTVPALEFPDCLAELSTIRTQALIAVFFQAALAIAYAGIAIPFFQIIEE